VLRCGFTSSSLSFRNGDLKGGGGGFAHEFANETTLEISMAAICLGDVSSSDLLASFVWKFHARKKIWLWALLK